MATRKHLQHIKSSQLNKVPSAQDLLFGEIAVNYAKDGETIYIKNADGEIVSFPSIKVIEENEQVTAQALSQLNENINANAESIEQLSNNISGDINDINEDITELDGKISDISDLIEENEHAIAGALVALNKKIDALIQVVNTNTTNIENILARI